MAQHQKAYRTNVGDILSALDTRKTGLSTQEADKRLAQYGKNTLKKTRHEPLIFAFARQFKDLMIILLCVSAGIALYLDDLRTSFVLLGIVFINACIGFIQEYKAEKILESLKKLVVEEADAYRDGKLITLPASLLVPGDILFINEGDAVPADARILEESELATNDFALTGESNPCRKFTHSINADVELGNQRNMIFMGTTVASGNALCAVTATGMNTELGKIASLSQGLKEGMSPLQKELQTLAVRLTIGTLILGFVLTLIALGADLSFRDAFLFAIGISSAMIPQGLPAEVNTALTSAAGRLAKQKALVKKLSAVETLGATQIICTDKTGTLTKNEMTVEYVTLFGHTYHVSGTGYEPRGQIHHASNAMALTHHELDSLRRFFVCGYFASNAHINPPDKEHSYWYSVGDPTEAALITLSLKAGLDTRALDETSPELREYPFDSVRKRMSSIRSYENETAIFVKGAPESVLSCCSHILLPNGKRRVLTDADRAVILKENDLYAQKAMRNLVYAYRPLTQRESPTSMTLESAESNLTYMGMVSMIDPLRDEVVEAMRATHEAHVKVSIITGDYAPTAKAIAVRAGLAENPDDITLIPGDTLPNLSDDKVLQLVQQGGVIFARVSPEDKLRIVNLVKESGSVIAVTGDGINDAPALKRADIGVAMGLSGTDVAKQSAEIVLLDDSFKTLIGAIQQGRTIFHNIKKSTLSCLSSNFGELFVILLSLATNSILGVPPAITAIQILAIDLIAELFPIAALAWDKPSSSLMKDMPRNTKEHIFNLRSMIDLIITGILMGGLGYINYVLYSDRNNIDLQTLSNSSVAYASATTLTYLTICLCQFMNICIRRSPERTISRYLLSNRVLWLAFGFSLFCIINIVYNPYIQAIFGTATLTLTDWLYALGAATIFFIIRELIKISRTKSS